MKKRKKAELDIQFNNLHDGQVEIFVRYDYEKLKFKATYGSSDPIGDLVYCLLKILDTGRRSAMIWSSNPYNYEFIFESSSDVLQLKMRQFANVKSGGTFNISTLAVQGTAYQIFRPFWKALRDLEANQLLVKYERATGKQFPINELRRLGEKVVAMK